MSNRKKQQARDLALSIFEGKNGKAILQMYDSLGLDVEAVLDYIDDMESDSLDAFIEENQ